MTDYNIISEESKKSSDVPLIAISEPLSAKKNRKKKLSNLNQPDTPLSNEQLPGIIHSPIKKDGETENVIPEKTPKKEIDDTLLHPHKKSSSETPKFSPQETDVSYFSSKSNVSSIHSSFDSTISFDHDVGELDLDEDEKRLLIEQQKLSKDLFKEDEYLQELEHLKEYISSQKLSKKKIHKTILSRIKNVILHFDKFWSDLFFGFFSHFQILALLWILPMRLPILFLKYTWLIKIFNFDIISYREEIGKYLSISGIPYFEIILFFWFFIPPILLVLWFFLPKFSIFQNRFVFEKILFHVLQILYIPMLVMTLVIGGCMNKGKSSFVCEVFCKGEKFFGSCLIITIPSLIIGVLYAITQPILLLYICKKLTIYHVNQKHDNYLRNLEVEKALNISNTYVYIRLHIISSFTRLGSYYYYFIKHVQVMLVIFCWMIINGPTDTDRTNEIILTVILFFIFMIPIILELIIRPYRLISRLLISQIFGWNVVLNIILSWMKSIDLKNAFFVDSSLFMLFILLNIISVLLVLSFFLAFLVFKTKWPIHKKVKKEIQTEYSHYLTAIRNGFLLYDHAIRTTPSFVRCDLLLAHKKYLQKLYLEAKMNNNPLAETFEDIILKLEEEYYANEPMTLLPQRRLQNNIGDLRKYMDRREKEMVLIPQRNRILLLKVMAYNSFRKLAGKKGILEEDIDKVEQIEDTEGVQVEEEKILVEEVDDAKSEKDEQLLLLDPKQPKKEVKLIDISDDDSELFKKTPLKESLVLNE